MASASRKSPMLKKSANGTPFPAAVIHLLAMKVMSRAFSELKAFTFKPEEPKKQATKGQKQILEENNKTLDFYAKVMISVEVTYIIFRFTFFNFNSSWFSWVLLLIVTALYSGLYKFMESMAKPTYSESGALIDGGMDLNSESGTAEHVKDLIILTAITQGLAIFTDWMWLLMFLQLMDLVIALAPDPRAPCRAMYLLWVYILAPWIFAQPDETEVDPKKQKKMERKMKRAGMM